MSKKVLMIISNGDKNVISAAMTFAAVSFENKLYSDLKVFFFGPSEKVISEDKDLQASLSKLIKDGITPVACVNVGNAFNITPKLNALGFNMMPVGKAIADLVNQDYVTMVF
ncbi:MAG: hypothetical protein ACP5F2_02800 [Athalassotoga sp.]|uniref:hypothetical protein n=1 Tax=Athalassotoga sp. TaxID=2022597 RepID=UPI003D03DC94